MKKVFCFAILYININSFCQIPVLKSKDTIKFVGLLRSPLGKYTGLAQVWHDSNGLLQYFEAWQKDSSNHKWEGTISFDKNGIPKAVLTQRLRDGVPHYTETEDSIFRFGKRSNLEKTTNGLRIPWGHSSLLFALYIQYILQLKKKEFISANLGIIRVHKIGNTTIKNEKGSKRLYLYMLTSDSIPFLRYAWFDTNNKIFSLPLAESHCDFLPAEWSTCQNQLVQAEFLACQADSKNPSLGGGDGPMSYGPGEFLCKLTTPEAAGGSLTIIDSSYSVKSDGLGSYINNGSDVRVIVGPMAGMLINSTKRYFTIDLNHPVSGDISKPLGIIKVHGWQGPFIPTGSDFYAEFSAQWYTEPDYKMHGLFEIPVGKTVYTEQLSPSFYIKGITYVLQMGPQPVGHCMSTGTTIHGDGTTRGTITRESRTKWIVDLPPGSIGRLFDLRYGFTKAINKGLYYVSLRYIIQR